MYCMLDWTKREALQYSVVYCKAVWCLHAAARCTVYLYA